MIRRLKTPLMILSLLAGTSCLQEPNLKTENGPEVPAQDVQKAILDAWENADFNSIKKDEFIYLEQDQKIASLDPKIVYKESSQILDRTEADANTWRYRFLIRSQAFENGSFKPVTAYENTIDMPKSPSLTSLSRSKASFPDSVEALQKSMAEGRVGLASSGGNNHYLGILTIQNMLAQCVKSEEWDVTCHNLRVSQTVGAPPAAVVNEPNCAGIPNCQIRYRKIAFDLVVNLKDEDSGSVRTEKVIYEMTISPDVPYLARVMEFCYQGMVPTATQRVLVKMCNRIEKFQAGN